MLSKLLATAAQGSSGAKSSRSGDFAMVSEGYDSLDGPWNLSNAVQVSELKNLIWTRVSRDIRTLLRDSWTRRCLAGYQRDKNRAALYLRRSEKSSNTLSLSINGNGTLQRTL